MATATMTITKDSPMGEIMEAYPSAKRALFTRYHIGGCSSCGFHASEKLGELCARNDIKDVQEVIDHINTSHENDQKLLISLGDFKKALDEGRKIEIIDIRSREEHEAVHIEGSRLLSQEGFQELMANPDKADLVVLYDHQGKYVLDAGAYFAGHGIPNVRCLDKGIDGWATEIDTNLPRYELE
jgi:rhodanese-related sulfurtransferase